MRLYSYYRSSCSYRVRIGLALKGIAYEYAAVHLLKGEQRAEGYSRLNPMAQVPALQLDDGRLLAQSMAILEWLEETHPEPPLLPREPYLRARTRMLAEVVNAGIQPLQNLRVLKAMKARGADPDEWSRSWIAEGLAALETAVQETAGAYCVGDQVTFADVVLVPQLYNARRFAIDLGAVPTLAVIDERCAALPASQAAHPDRQPDAPG